MRSGRAPDFVGIGVQKGGTTRWFQLICAHPGCVAEPDRKEVHFFDRFWCVPYGAADIVEYHALFDAPPSSCTGEWTPRYIFDPWAMALLKAAAPHARLLVLLRDPMARFVSGVTHAALHDEGELHTIVATDAFTRGLYGGQLSRVYAHFDPSQVLVLQYEACIDDAGNQLRRTYDFVGLDPDFVPASLDRRVFETRGEKLVLPDATRTALVEAYEDDLRALTRLVPDLDYGRWPTAVALGLG